MSAFRRDFDESECFFFLIKDKVVSEKVSNAIEKEFNSEPVCNKQYI